MTISLNDLVNWLHITPFELSIHIVGIIFSLSIAVLWDEKILDILCTNQKEIVLWWVFLPLWCADALVSYFNLVIFFRRIHYHKVSSDEIYCFTCAHVSSCEHEVIWIFLSLRLYVKISVIMDFVLIIYLLRRGHLSS